MMLRSCAWLLAWGVKGAWQETEFDAHKKTYRDAWGHNTEGPAHV